MRKCDLLYDNSQRRLADPPTLQVEALLSGW